jgi:two-component system, cell cycle response regulator
MAARILVVDDVPANARLLEARLRAEGCDVRVALNGADALRLARSGPVDLVLLDVVMPGLTGFEVCRALKADPLTAHVPVVLVTALDEPQDRLKGFECGADDVVTKPVDGTALVARVRSLLRREARSPRAAPPAAVEGAA